MFVYVLYHIDIYGVVHCIIHYISILYIINIKEIIIFIIILSKVNIILL
jgi:hypothetical protein